MKYDISNIYYYVLYRKYKLEQVGNTIKIKFLWESLNGKVWVAADQYKLI